MAKDNMKNRKNEEKNKNSKSRPYNSFEKLRDDLYIIYRNKEIDSNDFYSIMDELDDAERNKKCAIEVSIYMSKFICCVLLSVENNEIKCTFLVTF